MVIKYISGGDKAAEIGLKNEEFPSIKSLDIMWNRQDGILTFKYESFNPNNDRYTKVHFSQSFDPIRFLLPFIIQGKLLHQDIWLVGSDWHEPLLRQLNETYLTTKITT